MRTRTEYAHRPRVCDSVRVGVWMDVMARDNIAQLEPGADGMERWQADEYRMRVLWSPSVERSVVSDAGAWLSRCKAHDFAEAAAAVRARRDALLQVVDKRGSIFRLDLEIPEGSTFSAWLSFLKGLGQYLRGDWAVYRKALLDVPQQPGFPYDVTWPQMPEDV